MEAYTLFEVNQYIRRVIALNFDEPIWIECEINQSSYSRGNIYLDLIEKAEDSDNILAKAQGTIWYKQSLFLKKKLGDLYDAILRDGVHLKIKATVEFSERYGFSLNIVDLDPAYTFGQYELQRQKIIEQLKKAEMIDLNAQRPLPSVIQRIAVISSERAAGYQDFVNQLTNNPYGYVFSTVLIDSAMQGQNTERDVVSALEFCRNKAEDLDVVIIIRGGGSKLDLSGFDNYNIAASIAQHPLPVLTGIGHDIDYTVTDIVAHTVLKTPTAVANFLIDHNLNFENGVLQLQNHILSGTEYTLNKARTELGNITTFFHHKPMDILSKNSIKLDYLEDIVQKGWKRKLDLASQNLKAIAGVVNLANPSNVLKKGYTLVRQDGHLINVLAKLDTDINFNVQFSDGHLKAKKINDEE